jgi:hypothetical protein
MPVIIRVRRSPSSAAARRTADFAGTMQMKTANPRSSSLIRYLRHFALLDLKVMFPCVPVALRNFKEVQNSEFLQKVTKETKSHGYCPRPSFSSLPSVESESDVGVWLRLGRVRKICA